MRFHILALAGLLLPTVLIPATFAAAREACQPRSRTMERARDRAPSQADSIRARIDSVLTAVSDDLDFARASRELEAIFDQVIAFAHEDGALITDAAFAARMVTQLAQAERSLHRQLFELLRENDELARTLVFLVKPGDDVSRVYRILADLYAASPGGIANFPALASAICVVHDRPRALRASLPGSSRSVDPVALFDFYIRNAGQMVLSPRSTAAELLVYVVDTTADIDELRWALSRHGGDRMVQKRYGDLVYDTAHLKYNRPKKIEGHPYTLMNLRRFGGVCEDQAYYAANVARAIGVPAVYISAHGAGLGHAWVGVAQQRGRGVQWYMEEGRFDEYRHLRGRVRDPQTNRPITDDQVALSGPLSRTPIAGRWAAVAYSDGARRIWGLASDGDAAWPPALPAEEGFPEARPAEDAFGLVLLERAANAAPAMPEVWLALGEAARSGRLGGNDRARWFDAFFSAVGADHPDFCFNIMSEMIRSVDDAAEQAAAWDWVLRRYHRRADLCAEAILGRARAWRDSGDRNRAYADYIEVVNRYGNDASAAIIALREAERLLIEGNREGYTLEMYRQAFQRIRRPSTVSSSAYGGTNYYRIGDRYATLLEAAGQHGDAQRIRRLISAGAPRE